jgi:NADH-quinone oxidoreductase subunit J
MHVLVYTGALLVLFLFVIMLLNLRARELAFDRPRVWVPGLLALCLGVAMFLGVAALMASALSPATGAALPRGFGSPTAVGREIFGDPSTSSPARYLLAFELVSVLILCAILGGVVLGRRER